MQLNPVYLYPNRIVAYTTSSWTNERFRKVYNRNIKIYRSTDNQLEFQIKNGDQKATNILGTTVVFNLFNHETQTLLLSKDCETLSNISGSVRVILTDNEMLDLEPGLYSYSIFQEVREYDVDEHYTVITRKPLYVDDQFGAVSTIEVAGDVSGGLRPTVVINEFSYTNPTTVGEVDPLYFISSIIDARPSVTNPQSLHTFQFYFSDFEGSVTIQGSMGKGGAPSNWVDIPTGSIISPEPESSVTYKNIVGKWNWFRVKQTGHKGNSASFVINRNIDPSGSYDVSIRNAGTNYRIGEILVISGRRLGGKEGENDLIITVTDISENGSILDISFVGTPAVEPNFKTYVLEPVIPPKGSLDKILYR